MGRPNRHGLSEDSSISWSVRIERSLLEEWKAWVEASQAELPAAERQSPQQVVRALMRKVLKHSAPVSAPTPAFDAPSPRTIDTDEIEQGRKRRIELRLTESEYIAIAAIAAAKEASVQWWLISLVRATLTHGAAMGGAELKALAESNYQLMAIGRNLNQITHQINADPARYLHLVTAERIDALRERIEAHREKVSALITACSQRWRIH